MRRIVRSRQGRTLILLLNKGIIWFGVWIERRLAKYIFSLLYSNNITVQRIAKCKLNVCALTYISYLAIRW